MPTVGRRHSDPGPALTPAAFVLSQGDIALWR